MNDKNLRSVDLNLLVVLDVLLEEKHITKAAERLNITQSAMSKSFARIKEMFDDPILDRVAGGYELTVRAARLVNPVKDTLTDIQEIINSISFEPKTTKRTFIINTLDHIELIVSDKYMKLLEEESPNSKIIFMSRNSYAFDHLIKGNCDVILAAKPNHCPADVVIEELYKDRLVCIVDKEHPLANKPISLDDFLSFPHCILKTDFDDPMVDIALAKINKSRRITKESPHFVASITSLKGTNMIISVPEASAQAADKLVDFVTNELPFEVPELSMCMMWHKRNQDRTGHIWFREQLKSSFQTI